jgi:signal transduction histidine kinase
MSFEEKTSAAVYDMPSAAQDTVEHAAGERRAHASLSEGILRRNIRWFCALRWIVVTILLAFGAFSLVPGPLEAMGLHPYVVWPFAAGAFLAVANMAFLMHARTLTSEATGTGARLNLWAQIILDLLVLTLVVHYVGSLETYVAFAYLVHIVLACVFFSRAWSCVVTATACVLYAVCVGLEQAGILGRAGIFADHTFRSQIDQAPPVWIANTLWAIIIWVAVWFLTSGLSLAVFKGEAELSVTNRRLIAARSQKARHMLRTTHELKAPFAAIQANVQLLLGGYCGDLPDEARDVLDRISARSRRLATEIQQMLQLSNLRDVDESPPTRTDLDLAATLEWSVDQVQALAAERNVNIDVQIGPARTVAAADHMKMLFSNLLANAVNYSYADGSVLVACDEAADGVAIITIQDGGIGIAAAKLSKIFDEYYRTREAAAHNKQSSGLGLAIVRNVADMYNIRVRVASELAVGTTFTLTFPTRAAVPSARGTVRKETDDGIRSDC